LKYIFSFRIFEQLALALKTEFALKFFKPGYCRTPASYAYACPQKRIILEDDDVWKWINDRLEKNDSLMCFIGFS